MSETLIVGAGPAGLACALALRCQGLGGRLRILDPAGCWLEAWHQQLRRQDIAYLRSPAVHHPHPDPFALLADGGSEGLVASGGTHLPTTARFATFVRNTIDQSGLAGAVDQAHATDLQLDHAGRASVTLSDGSRLAPDRVILATNHRHPVVPAAVTELDGDRRLVHARQANVHAATPHHRVTIIGGGLSAAHLAIGAARRGAQVTMFTRRRLTARRYDVHPTWLGPRKLRPFQSEPDPAVRRRAIAQARGGGSIPHRILNELRGYVDAGRVDLRQRVEVRSINEVSSSLRLHASDGTHQMTDEVWLATGGHVDVTRDPLCASLPRAFPATVAGGLPELAADLRWPGTNVHLVGFQAALQLGPIAGNLIGHRRAALRVAAGLRGDDARNAEREVSRAATCPGQRITRRLR